ncbi:MAG: ABC transporter permease, partial [Gemmatimonadaceae bacterium]
MTGRWRFIPALAWRDSRASRRRLLTFMAAIAVGVAALVAIDSYTANIVRAIHDQSRDLLGGDLSLSSRDSFPPSVDSLLATLRGEGIRVGRMTSFASMVLLPRAKATRLVQVRAASPGVPFYGAIGTSPAGRWTALQTAPAAVVDSSLLVETGARVGDTLSLGAAHFAIIGTITNVPGDIGIAAALGPRVYIADRFVGETGLIVFGSRVSYEALLALPSGLDADRFITTYRTTLSDAHVRARTVAETERSLTRGVDTLHDFLDLVGLVALLLGGIGVASAIHAYVAEKTDTIAMLRCLGGTQYQVLAMYFTEAAALGLVGAAAGAVLGVAVQFEMPHVLGSFLPVNVQPAIVPRAVITGLAIGTWVAALFALLPLLRVRRITPLQALRQDASAEPARGVAWDLARPLAVAALMASVVGIAVWRSGSTQRGVFLSVGIGAAIALLWLAAAALGRLARWMLREQWPFVIRQGIANLYRPSNQTRAVVLALGFGAFLLGTVFLVQRSLVARLSLNDSDVRANLAFFDVQPDQVQGVDSLIAAARMPLVQQVPIVPMRIATISGTDSAGRTGAPGDARDAAAARGAAPNASSDAPSNAAPNAPRQGERRRPSWALRREYRSSYRDSLNQTEKLTAGHWVQGTDAPGTSLPWISVEQDVASELELAPGDTVTWDVQGVRIPTVVTSLREVNWARFEPNFFVIFSPAALQGAPATFVMLTRSSAPTAIAELQRTVVQHYSNVSSIDLSAVQRAVGSILQRIAVAIRFMALFSVGTGILVMLGAVGASRRQRIREGVLLKTLGATRAQIGRIMLSEYAMLGILASATGVVLSVVAAWALMRFVFDSPFTPSPLPIVALAVGAT